MSLEIRKLAEAIIDHALGDVVVALNQRERDAIWGCRAHLVCEADFKIREALGLYAPAAGKT